MSFSPSWQRRRGYGRAFDYEPGDDSGGSGGAYLLGLSPLVANIVLGLMLANLGSGAPRVFFCLNSFTPPIYLLFFTLVGASLQLAGLLPLLALGAAYILARAAGKLLGTWVGAWAAQAEPKVQKYLGFYFCPRVVCRWLWPPCCTGIFPNTAGPLQ